MKFCDICGIEISTPDGENTCRTCEDLQDQNKARELARRRLQRKANEAALRSCGLVKVRGALGGVYWE